MERKTKIPKKEYLFFILKKTNWRDIFFVIPLNVKYNIVININILKLMVTKISINKLLRI